MFCLKIPWNFFDTVFMDIPLDSIYQNKELAPCTVVELSDGYMIHKESGSIVFNPVRQALPNTPLT